MTESEIAVLISRMDSIKEQVEESKEEANRWRERFDEKMGFLKTSIDTLPCPARAEITKSLKGQVAWIWGILCIIVGAIITEWAIRR